MPKKPELFAYLIAVRQLDGSDHVYAILAGTKDEAIMMVAAHEPDGPKPRHVGAFGARTVERIGLKVGEVRKV
ncbi:hypothetical protein ACYQR9_00005 (plasmid) [Methylobacterium sp. CM6241]